MTSKYPKPSAGTFGLVEEGWWRGEGEGGDERLINYL